MTNQHQACDIYDKEEKIASGLTSCSVHHLIVTRNVLSCHIQILRRSFKLTANEVKCELY